MCVCVCVCVRVCITEVPELGNEGHVFEELAVVDCCDGRAVVELHKHLACFERTTDAGSEELCM